MVLATRPAPRGYPRAPASSGRAAIKAAPPTPPLDADARGRGEGHARQPPTTTEHRAPSGSGRRGEKEAGAPDCQSDRPPPLPAHTAMPRPAPGRRQDGTQRPALQAGGPRGRLQRRVAPPPHRRRPDGLSAGVSRRETGRGTEGRRSTPADPHLTTPPLDPDKKLPQKVRHAQRPRGVTPPSPQADQHA